MTSAREERIKAQFAEDYPEYANARIEVTKNADVLVYIEGIAHPMVLNYFDIE